ncbi:hypothetical protein WN943_017200 [Citrus x changshan-huyou]
MIFGLSPGLFMLPGNRVAATAVFGNRHNWTVAAQKLGSNYVKDFVTTSKAVLICWIRRHKSNVRWCRRKM